MGSLTMPLVVAMACVAFCWVTAGILNIDRLSRSIAALLMALPLLLGQYFVGWVGGTPLEPAAVAVIQVLMLIVAIVGGVHLAASTAWPDETSRFLNAFGALTVALTLPAAYGSVNPRPEQPVSETVLPDTSGLFRPDIFLIVPDAYSGRESLARYYEFDNGPFLDSLRVRGFSIPDQSRSNHVKTFLSLGIMLNRAYYDDEAWSAWEDRNPFYERMEVNRTAIDLKRLGYEFYYVGSSYPPLAANRLADVQISDGTEGRSREFERMWYRHTALLPVFNLCSALGSCTRTELPFIPETAAETEQRLDYLMELIDRPQRAFVYVHLLLPHGPFRFAADCYPRAVQWTVGQDAVQDEEELKRLYIEQLRCTNDQLLRIVDQIQKERSEAVIILQADHGHGRLTGGIPPRLTDTPRDKMEERFDVFAAYAGPGAVGDSIAVQSTPVNVFRSLFRVLWKVDEPPLPDLHYWYLGDSPPAVQEVEIDAPVIPGVIPEWVD